MESIDNIIISEDLAQALLYHSDKKMVVLCYCDSGTAQIMINNSLYSLHDGSVLLIPAFCEVILKDYDDSFRIGTIALKLETLIGFTKKMFVNGKSDWFSKREYILSNPLLQLSFNQQKRALKYRQIFGRYLKEDVITNRTLLVQKLVELVFIEVFGILDNTVIEHNNETNSNRANEVFQKFMSLLYKQTPIERDISWYADKLFVTPKYLSAISVQISGVSAYQWINDLILDESRNLLINSNLSIKEISHQLGFSSQSAFGKFIQRNEGLSPKEIRNNNKTAQ